MCTIVVFNQILDDYPVVIAANREELMHRDATGPKRLEESPRIVGGQDQAGGGTWMGATATGFFVGITNQYGSLTVDTSDSSILSRGALVMDVLRTGNPQDALAHLAEVDARRYREFNLLFGNSQALWVAYGRSDDANVTFAQVPKGVHVLPNDCLDAPDNRKVKRANELATPLVDTDWPETLEGLEAMLADHKKPPLEAFADEAIPASIPVAMFREMTSLCIHTPAYGTRSSTIVALAPEAVGRYLFAEGPPCEAAFDDVTHLLH